MQVFSYPVRLVRDRQDGGYVVTCRDMPEVITQGESVDDALEQAAGALQAAIEVRMLQGWEIPEPSPKKNREHLAAPPVSTAMKAALYCTMRERNISKSELARLLSLDEKEARRILDPRHATRIGTVEKALHALGKRIDVVVSS